MEYISQGLVNSIDKLGFTELWAILPNTIKRKDNYTGAVIYCGKRLSEDDGACLSYRDVHFEIAETPAGAARLMVGWLIDNGHMEVINETIR